MIRHLSSKCHHPMLRAFGMLCTMCWVLSTLPAVAAKPASGTPGNDFVLHEGNPVLTMAPGSWDSAVIHPGAVLYHDGSFHMFYGAKKSWRPGPLAIGYATSPDGFTWKRAVSDPILTLDNVPFTDSNIVPNSAFVQDGTWVLYFSASNVKKPLVKFTGVIGRATAPTPTGPWTVDSTPVLKPGPASTWDAESVGNASVTAVDDGYVMYYSALGGAGAKSMIGRATSADGIKWQKYNDTATRGVAYLHSDPVFGPKDGAWDNWHIIDPNVQRTAKGWTMIYRGAVGDTFGNIGLATSQDGIQWTRFGGNPIVTNRGVAERGVFYTSFLVKDGKPLVYFEAGFQETRVFLATRP